jgi:hypothetical protein
LFLKRKRFHHGSSAKAAIEAALAQALEDAARKLETTTNNAINDQVTANTSTGASQ